MAASIVGESPPGGRAVSCVRQAEGPVGTPCGDGPGIPDELGYPEELGIPGALE